MAIVLLRFTLIVPAAIAGLLVVVIVVICIAGNVSVVLPIGLIVVFICFTLLEDSCRNCCAAVDIDLNGGIVLTSFT